MTTSRRRFLQSSAQSGLAAAALAAFPPSIRKALAIPAHNETGTIKDVKHVVILMMENRGFDHYFGTYKGVRGFGDRFGIPLPDGRAVWQQLDANGKIDLPYHLDQTQGNAQRTSGTPHTWVNAQQAWDGGRIEQWARYKQNQSMGYFDEPEIPFQRALAEAFTICDDYHCSIQTGTHANRTMHVTGTTGIVNNVTFVDNFSGDFSVTASASAYFNWTTYAERLEGAGVSWKVYQNIKNTYGCNPLLGFKQYRMANEALPPQRQVNTSLSQAAEPVFDPADAVAQPLIKGYANTMPTTDPDPNTNGTFVQAFRDDVLNGRLPEVSWVIPTDVYSEHPGPSSPVQGAWFVQQILDALTAVPEVWSKTVLLINFDENDGYFDHVPPAAPPSPVGDGSYAGKTTLAPEALAGEYYTQPIVFRADTGAIAANQPPQDGKPYGPGPRVPLWVVSPWSRGGWVDSQTFDHTSILRFLEARFGPKETNISGFRRAMNGDLTSAFNFANPDGEPLPTLAGEMSKADADALRTQQQALPQIVPDPNRGFPVQVKGYRPSRALPYHLHASAHVDTAQGRVKLLFANTGRAAAVFHVYDKKNLDRLPRRYGVEPGKFLTDEWAAEAGTGAYDLWVLGPNGFHREFKGTLKAMMAAASGPEVRVGSDNRAGTLRLHLRNQGVKPVKFSVRSNKIYGPLSAARVPVADSLPFFAPSAVMGLGHVAVAGFGPFASGSTADDGARILRLDAAATEWDVTVSGHRAVELSWDLTGTGFWYDFKVVTDAGEDSFMRRVAGRIETGRHSVSDPGMGLADSF